jgi:hypothetical protein
MQCAGGSRETAVAVNGIKYVQEIEGDFHVNLIERFVQNYSLECFELYAYYGN